MTTDTDSLQRWFLWFPVWLGCGIGAYFSLPFEPPLQPLLLGTAGFAIITALAYRLGSRLNIILLAITISLSGLATSSLHARSSTSPIIGTSDGPFWLRATVEHIEHREHGYRIVLIENDLWQPHIKNIAKSRTPTRIRLNVRTDVPAGVQPGTRISVRAMLSAPPELPAYPGGYEFARYAFFQQLGAVGYTVSPIKIRNNTPDTPAISRLRHTVTERIWNALDDDQTVQKTVASALLTAERGAVPKDTLEAMRLSGLGHLLAISGLHMALVMAGVFVLTRILMSLSFTVNLHLPTKKIAAALALITGLIYLLLTGLPVSAVRAYIMAGLFFLAVLTDRLTSPMRPVAIAALIILLITPEALIHPSFQMSFAAVVALVGCYNWWNARRDFFQQRSMLVQGRGYISGILTTSLIAGLATTPFAMYHFGHITNYNLLSNLLAIPLTTMWIMPCGMVALLLMPFGLEALPLQWMGAGIAHLTDWAAYIVSLPHAQLLIPAFSEAYLALITLGGLWLFLWQGSAAKYGLYIMVIGWVLAMWPRPVPDIIIDESGKLFALRTFDNQLAFSNLNRARFARNQWLEATATREPLRISRLKAADLNGFTCTADMCHNDTGAHTIVIIPFESTLVDCPALPTKHFLVDLRPLAMCDQADILRHDVVQHGTHLVHLDGIDATIQTARQSVGTRLWTRQK